MNDKITKETLREDTVLQDGLLYEYRLFKRISMRVASYKIPLYSVSVRLTDGDEITESGLNDTFADIGKATVFYEQMVKHLVTPIDLPYILEDSMKIS